MTVIIFLVSSFVEKSNEEWGDAMESMNQIALRDINAGLILRIIRDFAPVSRTEIAERTGLASSTVTVITKEFQQKRLIRECGRANSTGGRRQVLLEVNPEGGHFICADLSASILTVGVVDFSFQLVAAWHSSMAGRFGEELYADLVKKLMRVQAWCKTRNLTQLAVGVATPGMIDPAEGRVMDADYLDWQDFDLQQRLQNDLACPVVVENDTNAAALAEFRFGDGRNHNFSNVMYVTMGTGVGSGLIIQGDLYRGSAGTAGEIGHVVVQMDGLRCVCGNYGCVETLASSSSMLREYRQNGGDVKDIDDLLKKAQSGDHGAVTVLQRAGRAIGLAIGSQANMLSLDAVFVGGLATQDANLFASIEDGARRSTLPRVPLQMGLASLGQTAGLIGVAWLSLDRVVKELLG